MKFAYVGPFARLLDSRVGRNFADTLPKHTASAEDYSIGAALSQKLVTLSIPALGVSGQGTALAAVEHIFGREQDSSGRRPRRRGGRGRKKVTA